MGSIRVIAPGPFSTLQDLGRRGRGHQGVARAGAFDLHSHRLANRLVGNREEAATIEILFGPCEYEAMRDVVLALTGTDVMITIRGTKLITEGAGGFRQQVSTRDEVCSRAFVVRSGERVAVGVPAHGLRTYLAVRGGFDMPPVLGSRSYDSLGQIGPPPLRAEDTLSIGSVVAADPWFEPIPLRPASDLISVPLMLGPRHDWLSNASLAALGLLTWTVDPASNRTGIRFAGPRLERRVGELASEAMIPGAVQLPPSGLPIVLGPDGGTTGGYPVIGVIGQSGMDALAQRRPGEEIRFHVLSVERL